MYKNVLLKHALVAMLALAALGCASLAYARDCTLNSNYTATGTIDIFSSGQQVTVPKVFWRCFFDQRMELAYANYCYRLEPIGNQKRDNFSFYAVQASGDSRLAFQMEGADFASISINDNSLNTEGFAWGLWSGPPGELMQRDADVWTIKFLPYAQQDRVRPGVYNSSYNFWIYQQDNSPNVINQCASMPFTSRSMAGKINLAITVKSRCDIEAPVDIDFGSVKAVAATRGATKAEGGVNVRCTYQTPYNLTVDNGQNAVSGQPRMKNANGTSFIPYRLYQKDCSTAVASGSVIYSGVGAAVNTVNTHGICAKLVTPIATAPSTGSYSDRITVNVTF